MPFPALIVAPGFHSRQYVYEMLRFGRAIRDEHLWQFPLLPAAVYTYQQMASGREFKVSGPESGVARAIEWLNNAQTLTYEGIIERGFEQFEKRRVLDYLCIGRNMFQWSKGNPLRYTDPSDMQFILHEQRWQNMYTGERVPVEDIVLHHPLPIGSSGFFVAPLAPVIPTAMLAWLIREHDKSAVDGRKIRDITIVAGEKLAEQLKNAVADVVASWAGFDPTKNNIPIIHAELIPGIKMGDMVAKLGISNIPEGLNRSDFQFEYVNETAASLGISLRHFWNSEKATNRALEEVQEARQQQKGPSAFVRTEQRLINASGCLTQFGRNVRMGFIEEVDVQSRESNARILKLYAEGLEKFAAVFGGQVNGDALLGWLQSEDILPPDLDLVTDLGTMVNPDQLPTVTSDGKIVQNGSETRPTRIESKEKALEDVPDYDEVTVDSSGKILEKRAKVISFEKILTNKLMKNELFVESVANATEPVNFEIALKVAREQNQKKFFTYVIEKSWTGPLLLEQQEKITEIINAEELTDQQHRWVKVILDKVAGDEKQPELLAEAI
jgi:hypothetical protein